MVQSKPLSVTLNNASDAWVDYAALRPTNLVPFFKLTHSTLHANVVLINADGSYVRTGANRLRDKRQQILIIASINRRDSRLINTNSD